MSYEKYTKIDEKLLHIPYCSDVNEAIQEIEHCIKYSPDRRGFKALKEHYPELYDFAMSSIDEPEIFDKFSDYCQKSIKNINEKKYPGYIPIKISSKKVKESDIEKADLAIKYINLTGSRPPNGHKLGKFLENVFYIGSQKRRMQLEYNIGSDLFRELEYKYFETTDSFSHILNAIRSIRIMEDSKERPNKLPALYDWLKRIFVNSSVGRRRLTVVKECIGDKLFEELEYWFNYTSPEENLIRFFKEAKINLEDKKKRFHRKDPCYSRLENFTNRINPLLDTVRSIEPVLVDTTLELWESLKKTNV
jgi:hypothetical protein